MLVESTQARVQVYLYDITGTLVAIFDDWNTFHLERRLNTYDLLTLSMDGEDPRHELFTIDCFIEVRRRIGDGQWYTESVLMHITGEEQITEGSKHLFTSYSRGLTDLLRRRSLNYYANTPYTLKAGPGETVIKEYVAENAGPLATSPPRISDGVTPGLTVEPTAGLGLLWAGQRSWQNLLEIIQEIALVTSIDFDVIKTGPTDFEFRCYYPQIGTDRTAEITFSPTLGNMMSPSYTLSRTEEVTRVIVLGQGQESDRHIIVRDLPTMFDSPWRLVEATLDARQESTFNGLIAAGDTFLAKRQAQESFAFTVLQTTAYQYGRDYFLGDVISASFDNVSTTKKITGASINIQDGRETIALEFATIPQGA